MENEETKTVEKEIELDETALKAISAEVSKGLEDKMAQSVADATAKAMETVLSKIEATDKKNVADDADKTKAVTNTEMKTIKVKSFDPSSKGEVIEVESRFAEESKHMRLLKACRALLAGDFERVKAYNQDALDVRAKAGYDNEGVTADGGALVPYPDFDEEVYENLPRYGVAFADATIRTVMSNQVRQIGLSAQLQFTETSEAAVIPGGKLALTQDTTALRKFALIVPATDELTEDSAIDFWALVTREMTRAYARKADELVFTDSSSGILHTSGVITQPLIAGGTDGTAITWDDLLQAQGKLEDYLGGGNYKWYMRKETYYRLIRTKASSSGVYQSTGWQYIPNPDTPVCPWGTPIVFTRVLNTSVQATNNSAYAVYGDLAVVTLYNKRGVVITPLREATVKDSTNTDFNLATQDGTALRFVVRMLAHVQQSVASKFVILGLGTVS